MFVPNCESPATHKDVRRIIVRGKRKSDQLSLNSETSARGGGMKHLSPPTPFSWQALENAQFITLGERPLPFLVRQDNNKL